LTRKLPRNRGVFLGPPHRHPEPRSSSWSPTVIRSASSPSWSSIVIRSTSSSSWAKRRISPPVPDSSLRSEWRGWARFLAPLGMTVAGRFDGQRYATPARDSLGILPPDTYCSLRAAQRAARPGNSDPE